MAERRKTFKLNESWHPPASDRMGRAKQWVWDIPGARWTLLRALYLAAYIWRRLCFRTRVVAVTGSLGKTTCKQLLTHLMAQRFSVTSTRHNQNDIFGVPRTLLRLRPWRQFAVVELAVAAPGQMPALARLVRPDIAVFLCVRPTHTVNFRDLDEHAAEKAKLLEGLKPGGWCVGNADDPRIAALVQKYPGRRALFGTQPGVDFRAERVEAAWPGRLRFQLRQAEHSLAVETQLVGSHWMPSAMGALAAATVAGIPLEQAVRATREVAPFPGRLRPMRLPSGAVTLRDDYSANLTGLEAAIAVLDCATARRRILAITDFSDSGKHRRQRLSFLARAAARSVDTCVLIGPEADYGKRRLVEAGLPEDCAFSFERWEDAARFLRGELKPDDLALLKGRTTDHLARLYFSLLGSTKCRKERCSKTILCDFCPQLGAVLADAAELVSAPAGNLEESNCGA